MNEEVTIVKQGFSVELTDDCEISEFPITIRNLIMGITPQKPIPERILQSGNRTIIFWNDGTKTIVKLADDEVDNPYNAFCSALAKKIYGSTSAVHKLVENNYQYQVPKGLREKTGKKYV